MSRVDARLRPIRFIYTVAGLGLMAYLYGAVATVIAIMLLIDIEIGDGR